MFDDQSFESKEFPSTIASEKIKKSNATQTVQLTNKHEAVQQSECHNVEVQTSAEEQLQEALKVDYNKLASFLNRVTPGVLRALDEIYDNNTINAFEEIALKDSTLQIRLLTKLSTLEESKLKRKISDICWSINGGLLAVSYSNICHETWCDHLSEIRQYEFSRDDKLLETTIKNYETNSCVTCLSYHLTEPSILAAGLFNGDVILWNFANENPVIPVQVCTHSDTVSSLLWRPRTINEPSLLITTSSDGYIFVHKSTGNFSNIKLYRRYKIVKEKNPVENSRPRSAGGRLERAVEAGLSITAIDFFAKDPEIFIAGTLCGGLYKCSMETTTPIQGDDSTFDPVIEAFDQSQGSITCIKCSSTNNIFITSNTNKEIRVFDTLQTMPVRVITVEHTVTGLRWIINNNDIISTYGAHSFVEFLDITNGNFRRNLQIASSGTNTACMNFNIKRDTIAIADTEGNIELWKIPKQNNSINSV